MIAVSGSIRMHRLLRAAIAAGAESVVRLHIMRGDDLEARDDQGLTALLVAAERGQAAICRMLLEAGADPHACNAQGQNAAALALNSGVAETSALFTPPSLAKSPDESSASTVRGNEEVALEYGDWEAETAEPPPPANDETLVELARLSNLRVGHYVPLEFTPEFDDIELALPTRAAPIQNEEDVELADKIRHLLLRAVREGSIPERAVLELGCEVRAECTEDVLPPICRVLSALGCDLDERVEYRSLWDNFHVPAGPQPTADEEYAMSEALEFLAIDGEYREPLHLLHRDARNFPLLSASEEVLLAQRIETAYDAALDNLAQWTKGLEGILKAARAVEGGELDLHSVVLINEIDPSPEAEGLEQGGAPSPDDEGSKNTLAEAGTPHGLARTRLSLAAADLSTLCARAPECTSLIETRDVLRGLKLRTTFLLDLEQYVGGDKSQGASGFRAAVATLRSARDRLTLSNLRLVLPIAKKYMRSGVPLADLVQEGHIGLIKAVDKFEWRKGFRFSTYATWWIRQGVARSVAESSRMIRLPVHVHETAYAIERFSRDWEREHGERPSPQIVSTELAVPERKIRRILRATLLVESLDALLESGDPPADLLAEFTCADPAEMYDVTELCSVIDGCVSSLETKEEHVIRARFGLGEVSPCTLEEISAALGVTRERVRQVEAATLRKLKRPTRSTTLLPWAPCDDEDGSQRSVGNRKTVLLRVEYGTLGRPSDLHPCMESSERQKPLGAGSQPGREWDAGHGPH